MSQKEVLIFRVALDCKAIIQLDGPVTRESIELLIEYMELTKKAVPPNNQVAQDRLTFYAVEDAICPNHGGGND